jgi:hypothetical protein
MCEGGGIVRRVGTLFTALLLAMLCLALAHRAARQARALAAPAFDPASFVRRIDNPFLPMKPGTTRVYTRGKGPRAERDEVAVMQDTKQILGVECTVVRDRGWADGNLAEDTRDWFAQDRTGNVWCLGEDSKAYRKGVLVSTEGSWKAGVRGAHAGLVMEAHPRVGDTYRQEVSPGVAEDRAVVISLGKYARVPYGRFHHLLMTEDWTPLGPDVAEYKYYARGVGLVLVISGETGSQRSELSEVRVAPGAAQ